MVSREPKKSRSGGSLSSSLSPYSQAKKRRVSVCACVCARCGFRECRKEDGEKQHGAATAAAAAAGSGERVREKEDKECAAKRERQVVVEKADRSCRGGWRRASSNCVGNEERQRRRRQQRRHPQRVCTHSRARVHPRVFSRCSLLSRSSIRSIQQTWPIERISRDLSLFFRTNLAIISFRFSFPRFRSVREICLTICCLRYMYMHKL